MDVFDSNVWVWGFTGQGSRPNQLINDVRNGTRDVNVNAYIFEEVVSAFEASNHPGANQALSNFASFVQRSSHVNGPDQHAVRQMDVHRVRTLPIVQMTGQILDIQPKDVPVLEAAYEYQSHLPTLYTCDRAFSQLTPSNHNLPDIDIVHVT